ncbi:TolB, C-terminal [Venustampulla echinocandica]|uniref:TolB, C-terminal n=1 Tax=Venustampulla echinocandica TaxID=2656787 RepID=A0A370T8J9_9HELO|nr:TolB, C-terminal [Venustampulla echinocandica]RDL29639.1 TolB, C-terminal [Venustampulla echinocandica]
MAAPGPLFQRLANIWRLLSLRSDVDHLILELLGSFSLEKIYADGDKDSYQTLVVTLLAQLNAIFHLQRLTLPSENLQVGWYLGFLVSWEVALRSVEFVLQTVLEGRESLWEVESLRGKYLAEFLLSALRVLALHPKAPANQRAKDRRDRFARIHRSLERVFDSYPGEQSFLLLVCKEVTDSLRTNPDSLALPPGLRYELPNIASELYPLPDCLSSQNVSTIVPSNGFSEDWLPQFLALRDISHFVVGASVQYVVNRETRDMRLQASSARIRNAVLHALDNLRIPGHISRADLISTFSETFRTVLPETPGFVRRISSDSQFDESEMDAIEALCSRLSDRQLIHRLSDREMMHSLSETTRLIALLDDPSGQFRAARPRLYAMNCSTCHLFGDSQLRNLGHFKFPPDTGENSEANLPPNSRCGACGEAVTVMREVSLARHTWDLLKPLEPNADTINVERHLPTQFQQAPPKVETGMTFQPGYSNILAGGPRLRDAGPYTTCRGPPERSRSISQTILSPISPGAPQISDPSRVGSSDSGNSKELIQAMLQKLDTGKQESLSPLEFAESSTSSQNRFEPTSSSIPIEAASPTRSRIVPMIVPPEKGRSRWRPRFGSRKESAGASGDTSSLSSATLESQRLEEISLKVLTTPPKKTSRGKIAKHIYVYLSQNSTYALFWNQTSIYIWDLGTSPATMSRAISAESTCVLAAVTKIHLAYIIGTRDQKLTLRIVNLIQPSVAAVEYRMSSSLWCRSITICPMENYVVVGFDNSIVRIFSTTNSEEPREDQLQTECKECQPVETLSFSNDGLVLLASTRSPKSGLIQVYLWRFPYLIFEEVPACRYQVPLHESEDGGVSSAIYRSGVGGEDNLICITTWTQLGTPILVQPQDGHRTDIRTEISNRQSRLGNRIQRAAFSPSGKELAIVNNKGDLYKISNLNSSPMDIKKIATSKELTAKSESFAMAFMTFPDEEAIVLSWTDFSKGTGFIKKIPTSLYGGGPLVLSTTSVTQLTQVIPESPKYELAADNKESQNLPAELISSNTRSTLNTTNRLGVAKNSFF